MAVPVNPQLILIVGETGCGKTTALRGLRNQHEWFYANHEAGRLLPFKETFKKAVLVDPMRIFNAFNTMVADPESQGLIIDSLTFMMDQFEKKYVLPCKDGREGWKNYFQFFTDIVLTSVPQCKRHVVVIAHTTEKVDSYGNIVRFVPVKGALKDKGVEAYFNNVIAAKRMLIRDLEGYSSPLLNITEAEQRKGFKYVFQTQVTAATVAERIRAPDGMWDESETFIDNNMQIVLDRFDQHYA